MAGGGVIGGGGGGGGPGKPYPGNLTPYVTVTCIVAAMGGLIFGYDIGISGNVSGIMLFFSCFLDWFLT